MCTDSNFAPWAATSIRSLIDRHPSDEITVHMLHDERLSPADRDSLARLTDGSATVIGFKEMDESRLLDLPSIGAAGRIVWWRLLLADVFSDLDRILFIDADTLVVDRVDELWATPLDAGPIGAVANVVDRNLRDYVRSVGVSDPLNYLNAGVLVLDLAQLRRTDATTALLDVAKQLRGRSMWADQDALNVVFDGRWHRLHPRWNAMNSFWTWPELAAEVHGGQLAEAKKKPAILHFEGPSVSKPWHFLSVHEWRDAYRDTLARTPWHATPLEDRTISTAVISRLPQRYRFPLYFRLLNARSRLGRAG